MTARQTPCSGVCSIVLLAFTLLLTEARAQVSLEKIKFTRIDVNAGLSNSNVTRILQDSKGFLWVGTSDGLNKYDGYNFSVYRQVPGDTTGLLNNSIGFIFEDSYGTLWISTANRGFYYYDRLYDRFHSVPELSEHGEIINISEGKDKTLWITGVLKQQAFVANLNRATNTWERHFLFPSHESAYGILHDDGDEYWIPVIRTGLFKWNRKTNVCTKVSDEKLNLSFHRMLQDHHKNIWFATRNGLSKLNSATKAFTHYKHDFNHPENSIPDFPIRDICLDGDLLWLATENGGLTRMNTKTETFTHFTSDKNDPSTISDNSVWTVYKDHQNRIWIGTYSKGLCVYDKMKDKFAELNIPLTNDIVNAIWKDSKERIWIGTEGGLVRYDHGKVKYYTHDRTKKGSLPDNPVLTIFEDSRQRMWFGTWDGGASRYHETTDSFINYEPDANNPSSLSNPNVYAIHEEKFSHRIMVATYNGLNILVDEASGKFEHYRDNRQEANNYLRTIYEDRQGTLWIGTITALNKEYTASQSMKRYLFDERNGSGTLVNCLAEDEAHNLWIGTNKGLHKMKDQTIVESYTTLDGLPNDIINGILIDDHNILWLSTTHGISRFDPATKNFTNFDVSDGLMSNEFKPNAAFKSRDGQLFFGGKSVNVFYPDSIKTNPHIPGVVLTGLRVLNKNISIGSADSILQHHISETKTITLNAASNYFTLEYVALNFTASTKNQFAYKLEGFDKDWVNVGTQRFATFTNLDPGTYTFHVKACNNDGLWNETGATLIITILPPWWKTWWFKTLLALAGIGIVLLISVIRTRNIEKANRLLEEIVHQKTHELQETNQALIKQEEAIKLQNMTLLEQREEMAAQNEELTLSQEEISAQRDLLEKQNNQLKEAQRIIEQHNLDIAQQNENLEKEVVKRTQELIEYNHQLEQFAFIAAHNLRAPVARILGLGQLLSLSQNKPEEREIIYPKLIHTTQELDSVVHDLNTILELKKNNTSYLTDVDLMSEVEMIRENLEREITLSETTIATDFSQCGSIHTVKPYLNSILFNLVSNAIKYRHPERKPEISIKTEMNGNEICLSVHDNGLGLDVSQHEEKLFTLYSRFHSHVEGKGMGLYLVKTQLKALGGRIEISSEVGKGTIFRAYFKNEINVTAENTSS